MFNDAFLMISKANSKFIVFQTGQLQCNSISYLLRLHGDQYGLTLFQFKYVLTNYEFFCDKEGSKKTTISLEKNAKNIRSE